MPLPTCQCNAGKPLSDQISNIYCALLEILAGQGGGEITLSQISDLDASWITPLQTPITPFGAAVLQIPGSVDSMLITDGAGVPSLLTQTSFTVTAAQILDATGAAQGLLTSLSVPVGQAFITIDNTNLADTVPIGITASQTPVTQVDTDRGVVTTLS